MADKSVPRDKQKKGTQDRHHAALLGDFHAAAARERANKALIPGIS